MTKEQLEEIYNVKVYSNKTYMPKGMYAEWFLEKISKPIPTAPDAILLDEFSGNWTKYYKVNLKK